MSRFIKGLAILAAAGVITGCQTAAVKPQTELASNPQLISSTQNRAITTTKTAKVTNLWQLTRQNLEFSDVDNERINNQIEWFQDHPNYVEYASKSASYYYYYVLNEVLKRDMPAELALLPYVESSYNPFAESSSKASGPWQFIPSTAAIYGLRSNWWYDGRRDIVESTQAALDYLTYLHGRFDDWLLALAAYNGGEGTVSRAMRRNRKAGKPTDYWHLDLPRETMYYVPKLLAISEMINTPSEFDLTLPQMPNKPYFDIVEIDGQIELRTAAELAGISEKELLQLNPGYSRWATDPEGPHRLLLPVGTDEKFLEGFAELPASERVRWAHYRIRSGDSLSRIAHKYDTSVAEIKRANHLSNNMLRVGQNLIIPSRPADKITPTTAIASNTRPSRSSRTESVRKIAEQNRLVHTVNSGDNLWKIAQQYGVSTDQLTLWNDLNNNMLHPGQDIVVYLSKEDSAS